ncbi:ABC transporter permease [Rhodohalobacter sp. 8-1]|uniref:ABC transporter permease n=1 Tax=Rhodohalobacter sp. 8-1 TaxID=3131972 RepID=UPI0030EE83FC
MYLKLAWRNIWRNKRRTLITVSSIMFAVIFAMFLESIERGSHNVAIENMTRFHTGYIQVQDYRFEDQPSLDNAFLYDAEQRNQILSASESINYLVPRIETFMLAAGDDVTKGAMVLGIDPEKEDRLNNLKSHLVEGAFSSGNQTAVIAAGFAERLELSRGDSLVLLGQGRFGRTAAGKFEITGIVDLPMRAMNNQMVYLSLENAQRLFSADQRITNLLVTPNSPQQVEQAAREIAEAISGGDLRVFTWQELLPDLVEALNFDRASTRFLMGILYVVIGFGIFGTILTMTLERLYEFGMLISIGMHRAKLASVVFLETLFMAIIGVASGYFFSTFLLLYFKANPIELGGDAAEIISEYGFDPIIPAAIASDIYLFQGAFVFALSILISFYPIMKIFTLNTMEASRK